MVRRRFPVAKIVGSSPIGIVRISFWGAFGNFLSNFFEEREAEAVVALQVCFDVLGTPEWYDAVVSEIHHFKFCETKP
jgi:hypothetical protein